MMDDLEQDRPNDERRATGRAPVSFKISIRQRGRNQQPATTTNLSPFGCAVSETFLIADQQTVWVRLPGLESQMATLRWARHGTAGFAFDHPLHPLVFARFADSTASDGQACPQQNPLATHPAEGSNSRKAQILAGWADPSERILAKKEPLPDGKSFGGLIRRRTARVADHRRERRYPSPLGATGTVSVGEHSAKIFNLSASGLQIEFGSRVEIGSSLPVIFEGCASLTAQVVWARGEQLGLALPRDSIDLREIPDAESELGALH